jgi:hypothetical protein
MAKKDSNKTEFTHRDLLALSQGIAYLNSKETKVWHALSLNLEVLSPIITEINKRHKDLTEKLAKKDTNGIPIKNEQNQIDFGDKLEEANKTWESVMEEKVSLELTPIPLDDLKEYGLDANIMKPLMGKLVV